MALPRVTDLKKIARKRSSILRASESGLIKKTTSQERRLNSYVLNTLIPSLEIEGGRIKNTNANLKKINKAGGLKKFVKNVINGQMYEYYLKEFSRITEQTNRYFNQFEPTQATTDRINSRGITTINGFIDEIFDNNEVTKAIQSTLRASITSKQNVSDVKALLTEQIKGTEEKLGSLSSYHYKNGYNEFQKYARGLDEDFSTALNLNYAIYAGGKIKTTRNFCDERKGNVYTREEILSWNDLEWQGKDPSASVIINLGGYNCRHDLDWISYALARRLRNDIERSKFDKI